MDEVLAPVFDAAHRAALEGGKSLVYVSPPAGWAVAPLLTAAMPSGPVAGGAPATVVFVADIPGGWDLLAATEHEESLAPVHVATGRARSERLLRAGAVRTLLITPPDALALVRRAALKLTEVRRVVVAWPEAMLLAAQGESLDALLADAAGAQRLVATTDASGLSDFLTRHAHRAPVATLSQPPLAPSGSVRFATVAATSDRLSAAREALDHLNPGSTFVWDPVTARRDGWRSVCAGDLAHTSPDPTGDAVELAVAADCPSYEVLEALRARADQVLVLVRATQVTYLERLVHELRAFPRTSEADAARDRSFEVRRRLRERLDRGALDAELLALAPLFQEFDPALVAAAATSLPPATGDAPVAAEVSAWARVHLALGRRDRIGPGDLVGVLANVIGVARDDIGRIEIRDRFSILDVRPGDVERVVRGLSATVIKGRRVQARPDSR